MRVIGSKRVWLLLMCSRRVEQGQRFKQRHESDASSAPTLLGDVAATPGEMASRGIALREMEDLAIDTHVG